MLLFIAVLVPFLIGSSTWAKEEQADQSVILRPHGVTNYCVLASAPAGWALVPDSPWNVYTTHGTLTVGPCDEVQYLPMKWDLSPETKSDVILSTEDLTSYPFYALDAGDLSKDDRVTIKPKDEGKPAQKWTHQKDKRISVMVNGTTTRCLTYNATQEATRELDNRALITTNCGEGAQDMTSTFQQVWEITEAK
ncbi:uncharacterized protein I303_104066 [Kwoniella dejecticola CBS 10117]|uniref:Uncharacterized protein n=1 Tax=Kwoniella dejecticola CBS 10117 TaxID=1296121 RepID=A0A1A6A8I0_9TREE|nr:uncharacterized protein I303_04085 [Kwoniella dejecticola CBS 10117]OBR86361.1 hypothetical protein I303_04085 [Kwoniella dejecticola CBS 10117]